MSRSFAIRIAVAVVGISVLTIALAFPVSASQGTGNVTVEATNNAAITLSINDGTADFGSNIDPLGTDSNSSDAGRVTDFQDTAGSYYVWQSSGGDGLVVSVRSNKSWTGTVAASRNTGTSTSMSIESGVLRYSSGSLGNYYDAALATPFITSGATFEPSGAKGVHDYHYVYALRVNWDDDPGTFVSSVTYSVTN